MRDAVHTHPLVEVVWDDAVTADDTWVSDMDELPEPERAYTVGYLLKDEPSHMVVAQTWGLKKDGTEEIGNAWAIPKGMIIRVEYLRMGPPDAE